MTEKQWIELVAPYAVNASRLYGYPASVLIAQSALETGYGQGYNCEVLVKLGNLLGMKSDLLNDTWDSKWWDGRSATKQTPNTTLRVGLRLQMLSASTLKVAITAFKIVLTTIASL